MCINQFIRTIITSLFIAFGFIGSAYAEITYLGKVETGDVLISVNDKEAKPYKQGDSFKLVADDLVCLRSGDGVVVVSGSANSFKEKLSKPTQCQSTPQKNMEKGWFSNAKKAVVEVGKEGMPDDLVSSSVKTSLITLNNIEYFVLENSSWHKNDNTLPFTLELIVDDRTIKKYVSHHRNTTLFFIPRKDIEEANGQSYTLRVVNKFGSEILKATRFSLKEVNSVDDKLLTEDGNRSLYYQLDHYLELLKENEKIKGKSHPDTAAINTEIGLLNIQLKKYTEATVYLENALKAREAAALSNKTTAKKVELAKNYQNLELAYEKINVIVKANEYKSKAIETWEEALGKKSRGNRMGAADNHKKVFYKEDDHTIVDILYGTDRAKNNEYINGKSLETFFSGERSLLQYGVVQVSIPNTHKFGEMERPPGWNMFSKETIGKHVMLKSIEEMNSKEFIETLNKKLGNVKENDLLVFIHGYNVSFADAARRTAQLSYDLKFQGVPLTYSWPSLSETEEYLTDEASAQYTVPHLVTFLKDVIDNNKESKNKANIHIIVHSMGSRALSYAVKELSLVYKDEQLFKNIIFAAPDIDKDVFEVSVFPYVRKTAEKITLYASSEDKALIVSASMHGGERVGQGGDDIFIFEGLDTIDASGVDTDFFSFSHSYFSEKKLMVNDIKELIYKSLPPSKRKTLIGKSKNKLAYWGLKFD